MASPDGKKLVDKQQTSGPDVAKILAVEENPDYSTGFFIVELDDATRKDWVSRIGHITRPTAIDALGFAQFAVHPNAQSCLGVTSGGMPEAMVRGVKLSQTVIRRQP
jgi:hypothetical protein